MSKLFYSATIAAALFCVGITQQSLAADQPATSQARAKPNKVIFSVTDNDKGKWNLVINNAAAVQRNVGPKDIE